MKKLFIFLAFLVFSFNVFSNGGFTDSDDWDQMLDFYKWDESDDLHSRERAIEYWQNASSHFCVTLGDDGVFSGSYGDIYMIMDGKQVQASLIVNQPIHSPLALEVFEYEIRSIQGYALEASKRIAPIVYPICKQ